MTWSLRLFQTTPGDFDTTAYKSWVQRWWLCLIYLGNTFDHHCDWQFPFAWKGCQQLWLSFLLLFNQDIYNLLLLWMSCLSPRLLETCHHLDSLPLPLSSLGRWVVDSIAVQYLWILVELDKYCIRTKDPCNHSDTETETQSTLEIFSF